MHGVGRSSIARFARTSFTAVVEVSLNDMFGYSSQLRGAIQGKSEFSMEYKVISAWSGVECGAARLIYDGEQHASITKMCRLSCRKHIASHFYKITKSKLRLGGVDGPRPTVSEQ